ncbi:MAG: right-handed parallel beta-helix repeat-containing protein, partial [Proteobacteria bacterium]|nr:right-handed parallel beta-helix repeat-containing protein [Pseudomonadota bacterium]
IYRTGGDGIEVASNTNAFVDYNYIEDAGANGIYILNTEGLEVTRNHILRAGNEGILGENVQDGLIDGNDVEDPSSDGIRFDGSRNITVSNNDVTGGNDQGIEFDDSSDIEIFGNYVTWFEDGIDVDDSNDVNIHDNYVEYMDYNGIEVSDSGDVVIRNNYVYDVGNDGIFVDYAYSDYNYYAVEITDNEVDSTGDDGIEVIYGGRTLISGNDVYNAGANYYGASYYGDYYGGDGIHVRGVHGDGYYGEGYYAGYAVEILDNDVENTGDDGIEVLDSGRTLIAGNDIYDTGYGDYGYYGDYYGADGIHVRNVFADGEYYGAGYYGEGYGGYDVNIFDNYVSTTGDDGIEVLNSGSTIIGWNYVYHSGAGNGGDWYGADGIHVRGVSGDGYSDGYYGDYGFDPYAVVITDNDVDLTYDDGIEVVDSGRTLIEDNEVSRAGFGMETYYGGYYGYYGEGYYGDYGYYTFPTSGGDDGYGADGIHVRNVYAGYYGEGGPEFLLAGFIGEEGYYGGYDVNIIGNDVDTTTDDGIEVLYSGSTLIGDNTVNNAGTYYGEYADYHGGDGIHVRGVHGDLFGPGYYGDYGVSPYSVVIIDNDVDTTHDDGIEVVQSGRTRIEGNDVFNAGGNAYYGDYGYYGYYGYYGEDDIFGADGIHVRQVYGEERKLFDGYYGGYAVEIVGNNVDTTGDDGIQVLFSGNTLIDTNTVANAGANNGARIFGADGIHVLNNFGFFGYDEGPSFDSEFGIGFGGGFVVDIVNNTVSDSEDDGIEVMGVGNFLIDNNDVDRSGDDGISVLSFNGFFEEPESEGEGEEVFLVSYVPSFDFGTVISNNTVDDSGENGLYFGGPSGGDVEVLGNTFTNNPVGALFESGRIDMIGATNTINGGHTGLLFQPFYLYGDEEEEVFEYAGMSLVDNTIGTTVFNGQSDFYVYLDDSAFWAPGFPTIIDGTNATFDGTNPASTGGFIPLGEYNRIEAMIHDFVDEDFRGLFFFGLPGDLFDGDLEDIFRELGLFDNGPGGLNITITGLPGVPGNLAAFLAGISPAAGGEEGEQGAEDLANIEPAAGGEESVCWGDAITNALNGVTTNYSFSGSMAEAINDATNCQSEEL